MLWKRLPISLRDYFQTSMLTRALTWWDDYFKDSNVKYTSNLFWVLIVIG